jgi:hypothetical protein
MIENESQNHAPSGVALSTVRSKPFVRTISREVEVDCDVDDDVDTENEATIVIMTIKHMMMVFKEDLPLLFLVTNIVLFCCFRFC